jgi:hypothetical protein
VLREKLKNLKSKTKKSSVTEELNERAQTRRRGDDDSSEDGERDFRLAPDRSEEQRVHRKAESDPGHCFSTGVRQMMNHLAIRSGASADGTNASELTPCAVNFLTSVYHGTNPPSTIGMRNSRELRTWCEVMDALVVGDLTYLGDLAMQRVKAIMLSVQDGHWNQAKFLELIPPNDVQLVSSDERRSMIRDRALEHRLIGKAPPSSSF